jgi:hypothetical protein
MNRKIPSLLFSILLFILASCDKGSEILEKPHIMLDIPAEGFQVKINETFSLTAHAENAQEATYLWLIDGEEFSEQKTLEFTPTEVKTYQILLIVSTEAGKDQLPFALNVKAADDQPVTGDSSPYITKVFDYQYAPGQHAQTLAYGKDGSDFIGNTSAYVMLGGWGGYIAAGFDHTISNEKGYDFGVFTQPSSSSEPAVVFVMKDLNGDGQPNDSEWIELKGSEFEHSETIRDYEVTYFKPAEGEYVRWEDNQGNSGELVPGYGNDSWWWHEDQEQVTLKGVKLPYSHFEDGPENWTNYTDRFQWGYAENYLGEDHDPNLKANLFDISNAVDQEGNAVELSGIDFIKVQNGVFQVAGWLNEISTEVKGAFDYRMKDQLQSAQN